VVGEREHIGQGGVRERERGRDRNGAGHVRDAVVGDPVDLVDGIGVGGRSRGLEAAALVDRYVHEHGALLHQPELVPLHDVRRTRPVDQHRADHEVRARQHLLHGERRRVDGRGAAAERHVELAEPVDVAVEDEHVRLHADRDEGRVLADHAAADDHHRGRRDAGHAAEQHAAAAERALEEERAGLRGDLPGHLAHRGEQREPPVLVDDGLIGDAGGARLHEALRELRVRREMQVGEQQVVGAEQLHLPRLWLLDAQDQLSLLEHRLRVGQDARALCHVLVVRDRAPDPRLGLDEHLVPVLDELPHARRREGHAVLVRLDLRRNPDLHPV
jgi:hypothetical protein